MKRVVPTIDFRDQGKSRSANEHIAAERLVGQLFVQAIQENDAYLQAMRQIGIDVTAAIRAKLAEVRRSLRRADKQVWEARVLLVALHAFQHGEKAKLRAWMKERYGTKPDTILSTELQRDALRIKDDTDVGTMVAFVRDLLDGHNPRLTEKRERDRRDEAEEMLDDWRKVGELRRALNQYDGDDQVTEVHRAMFEAEKSLRPGEVLTTGKVRWRVRYDNRPSHKSVDSPRKKEFNQWGKGDPVAFSRWLWHTAALRDEVGFPSDQIARLDAPDLPELTKFLEDPHSLALYDAVHNGLLLEWLDILAQQRLEPREFEVLAMMRHGYKQYEMAARLGITKGRVSQLVGQVHEKLAHIA